jgi:hypothetical protein
MRGGNILLSHACALLDIRMHIFDSFAGLPPAADSDHTRGPGSLQKTGSHCLARCSKGAGHEYQ